MAKERILIVDDEEDIIELIAYNLTRDGFVTETAMTGESALDMARRGKPDLVVLDLMLPGIDGLDVCRLLKSDPATAGIPVIMLTAKGEDADIVAGLELGADDYVTKPFSPRSCWPDQSVRDAGAWRAGGKFVHPHGTHSDQPLIPRSHRGRRTVLLTASNLTSRLLTRRPDGCLPATDHHAIRGEDYPVTERSSTCRSGAPQELARMKANTDDREIGTGSRTEDLPRTRHSSGR